MTLKLGGISLQTRHVYSTLNDVETIIHTSFQRGIHMGEFVGLKVSTPNKVTKTIIFNELLPVLWWHVTCHICLTLIKKTSMRSTKFASKNTFHPKITQHSNLTIVLVSCIKLIKQDFFCELLIWQNKTVTYNDHIL